MDVFPFLSISVHPTIWGYIDSRGWRGIEMVEGKAPSSRRLWPPRRC